MRQVSSLVWASLGVLVVAIGVLAMILFRHSGERVVVDRRVIVGDSSEVVELLKRDTPVSLALVDEQLGKAVIDDAQQLFTLRWALESLELSQGSARGEQAREERMAPATSRFGDTTLRMQFFDGGTQDFVIGSRFRLRDFLVANRAENKTVADFYGILLLTLQPREHLIYQIQGADRVYAYAGNVPFVATEAIAPGTDVRTEDGSAGRDGGRGDTTGSAAVPQGTDRRVRQLTPTEKRVLLDRIRQSERIMESAELTLFLQIYGHNPVFNIMVVDRSQAVGHHLVISVLSYSYFSVTDLSYRNPHQFFFRGNLLQLMEALFVGAVCGGQVRTWSGPGPSLTPSLTPTSSIPMGVS